MEACLEDDVRRESIATLAGRLSFGDTVGDERL